MVRTTVFDEKERPEKQENSLSLLSTNVFCFLTDLIQRHYHERQHECIAKHVFSLVETSLILCK